MCVAQKYACWFCKLGSSACEIYIYLFFFIVVVEVTVANSKKEVQRHRYIVKYLQINSFHLENHENMWIEIKHRIMMRRSKLYCLSFVLRMLCYYYCYQISTRNAQAFSKSSITFSLFSCICFSCCFCCCFTFLFFSHSSEIRWKGKAFNSWAPKTNKLVKSQFSY